MNTSTFGEMIDSLHEAQHVVRTEFEWFSQAKGHDCDVLTRLARSVKNLAGQADSLLILMTDRGSADALVEATEELFNFFLDTEKRIAALLRAAELEERQPCMQSRVH